MLGGDVKFGMGISRCLLWSTALLKILRS